MLPAERERNNHLERIAKALENIAASLIIASKPPVKSEKKVEIYSDSLIAPCLKTTLNAER